MLVTLLALLVTTPGAPAVSTSSAPTHATVTTMPAAPPHGWDGARWSLELVVDGAAQAVTAGTAPVSSVALRGGGVNESGAGPFFGGDASLVIGNQSAGTVDVSVTQVPLLLEARGLGGARFRRGFVGVGGYGFLAGAGGVAATATHAFDDVIMRTGPSWRLRAGAGVEVDVGPLLLRIETGAGARDLNPEVFGSAGLGFRW
jgi:hypothetical protein